MFIKALCSIGLHRYTHISEEMVYISRMEFCGVGYEYFYKVCGCGHRKSIDSIDHSRLPIVAKPMYSYLNR